MAKSRSLVIVCSISRTLPMTFGYVQSVSATFSLSLFPSLFFLVSVSNPRIAVYSWIDVADNFHAFQSNSLFMRHVWPVYRIRIDEIFEMITLRLNRIYAHCVTQLWNMRKEERKRRKENVFFRYDQYSKLII